MEEEKNDEISYEIISQYNESTADSKDLDLNISLDESSTNVITAAPVTPSDGFDQSQYSENAPKLTRIGNKLYDEHTLNRITIVRLTQIGIPPSLIKRMLNISGALLYKWKNYDKRTPKKMGRPLKFDQEQIDFIYNESEGKLTIENKASSRDIAAKFYKKFNKKISHSYICKLLLNKYGRPYRGLNSVLLTDDHVSQRILFANEIIKNGIKSDDIIFTDECRIVLYPKINPKINVIRLNSEDKKNIHTFEVSKKRTYFQPKYETSIMVAGGITKYGLTNLIFCSGTMNNYSYKQFLLFIKKDMAEMKQKFKLKNDILFQQDNACCHKSRDSLDTIEILFGKNKIWWPPNSPDLSPIETVWAIVKQELSKKKNNNLEELRNNLIDIWSRFPNELCEKIVGEFDDKIRICQNEEGKIVNKAIMSKYSNLKKKLIGEKNNYENNMYDWDSKKRDRNFRVVYNDKIIDAVKKRVILSLDRIKSEKIKKIKNETINDEKINKVVSKKKLNEQMKNKIESNFHKLIKYIKKCSTTEFITDIMNKGIINDKKFLINTRISKKVSVNEQFVDKLFELYEKEEYAHKKMKQIFKIINDNPDNTINSETTMITEQEKETNGTKEDDEEYKVIDMCDIMPDLNYQIKKFRKKNKENHKKIKIGNENKEDGKDNSDNEGNDHSEEYSSNSDDYSKSSSSESSDENESGSYSSSSGSSSDSNSD